MKNNILGRLIYETDLDINQKIESVTRANLFL